VIEDVMGAVLAHQREAALGARRAEHGEPRRHRELTRADADAAAGPVHEDGLAG
jgi:hypothetical protein